MKKGLTTLLVILLAVGAMLVSCKAEVGTPADELVSASFELGSSRALSATLEQFNPENYYWKYAAKKNVADTSGLNSGATNPYSEAGALWVKTGTQGPAKGLAGYIVPNFSQGLWDFTLYAYKRTGEGTELSPYVYTLVYVGEATAVSLVRGGTNMVHVVVSPLPTGTGTLVIGDTYLKPRDIDDHPQVSRVLKVEDLNGQEYYPATGTTYELAAGAYKVTVTYKASTIVYADGTVIATVYPNMTTTVTGYVDELVTYAQFEAEENPDIIARTASVNGIHKNDNVSDKYTLSDTNTTDSRVTASVPAAAAKNLLPKDSEEQIIADASMSLMLNVDTKDSTSTSVTYEISMTKVVTLDSEVTTSDVTDLGTDAQTQKKYYATAMVQLSTGLTGVKVQHDGHDMVESTDTAQDAGYGIYSYNATTGILTIVTNTFSPFAVSYDPIVYVAKIGEKKYTSVEAALADVGTEETTIVLLNSATADSLAINGGKDVILDLGGFELKSGFTYVLNGSLVVKNGLINGIWVYGLENDESGMTSYLKVESDAVVEDGYAIVLSNLSGTSSAYDATIDVNGTLSGWLWVMGNITGDKGDCVININNGAKTNNIALQGYAIVNINEGAEVVGPADEDASAIEVRSGKLNVNGGSIICNYKPTEADLNNNGTSTKGAGIAISQYNNNSIVVTLKDATIKGDVGMYWVHTYDEFLQTTNVRIPYFSDSHFDDDTSDWEKGGTTANTLSLVGKDTNSAVRIAENVVEDEGATTQYLEYMNIQSYGMGWTFQGQW